MVIALTWLIMKPVIKIKNAKGVQQKYERPS